MCVCRVQSVLRAAAADATDGHDQLLDPATTAASADAAEPFNAKKRVAFKDDVSVDSGAGGGAASCSEMGDRLSPPVPGRRSPATPPSHDDLAAAGTQAGRPGRGGPRARPGGVGAAGRRPLAR